MPVAQEHDEYTIMIEGLDRIIQASVSSQPWNQIYLANNVDVVIAYFRLFTRLYQVLKLCL